MKNKYRAFALMLSLTLVLVLTVMTQKNESDAETSESATSFSSNEQLVLHSLRLIHSAEITYASTYGSGNFATLQSMQQADLIDPVLATGQKHGYRFTMTVRTATSTMQAGFDVTATPINRRVKILSFYMNEGCDIRGAQRFGRDATIDDPTIEPCGFSLRSDNERVVMGFLRNIHGAQMTYQATYGAGQYGTMSQLFAANLVTGGFALSYIWRGYISQMTVTPGTPTSQPRFVIRVIPQQYGRTGVRSFYIDETGVLRGADKNGAAADENDPPIVPTP